MKILISLHDATPFHLPRLRKAEAVFRELGLSKVTYLFVPEFHRRYPSAEHPEFIEWCRAPRDFAVQWVLHGYHHIETLDEGNDKSGTASDVFKRNFLTGGEGEFLAMSAAVQKQKLEAGRNSFLRCLQTEPEGFVAPAWLFNSDLFPLLKGQGFRFTEDHGKVYRVDRGTQLRSPVITWATRTFIRKYGSLVVCPLLARLWAREPALRVAVHPFDFDHAVTVENIRKVLRRLIKTREQAFISELNF